MAPQPVPPSSDQPFSRRDFLKHSAALSAGLTAGSTLAFAQAPAIQHDRHKPEMIRVGVVGCGGRGTGAALDCVRAAPNIELIALGDLFADRLKSSRQRLEEHAADACRVTDDHCFVGFEAYRQVLTAPIDLVILATPPGFRPAHLTAAVAAGKHVFTEKPVAVDPVGIRKVFAAADAAKQKHLAIVAGTQRRHDPSYITTMKRVQDGAIGDLVGGQCYWNQGGLWAVERTPDMSEMEWQCRNWLYFTWLSGDHIVEQHIHNIDILNWAFGGPPVKALGMGGRQARTDDRYGNVYDHFAVEYEYANGARVLSTCRQIEGTSGRIGERLVGTQGTANPAGRIDGPNAFQFEHTGDPVNPYVQEHRDLIKSIRANEPLNELRQVAESNLTAIMGRMSAYTGRELSYDWVLNRSQLDLSPQHYAFGDHAVDPVAVPGQTELV